MAFGLRSRSTGTRDFAPANGAASPSLNYDDIKLAIDKRLFVGRIPPGTSEDELAIVFGLYGSLTECRIVSGSGAGSNGIGFVGFETWASAYGALIDTDGKKQLSGHEGSRSTLVVSFAERTQEVGRGGGAAYAKGLEINRVFVGTLPEDTSEQELSSAFSVAGRIEMIKLLPAKQRLRCGYVTLGNWGEAMDAVERLHLSPLRSGSEPMTVTLAEPRNADRAWSGREPLDVSSVSSRWPPYSAGGGSGGGYHGPPSVSAAQPVVKRPRLDNLVPVMSKGDLNTLLAAYIAAVASDSPQSACDAIHEQLMQQRELLAGGGGGAKGHSAAHASLRNGYGHGGHGSHDIHGSNAGHGRGHGNSGGHGLRPELAKPRSSFNSGNTNSWNSQQPAGSAPADTGACSSPAEGESVAARLFVGGLPHDCNDEDLMSLVSQLSFTVSPENALLLECRVLTGRGCGYLRYSTVEAAEEAFAALQDRQVTGWQQPLRVQWATPKSDKATPQQSGTPESLCNATQAEVEAQGLDPTRLFVGQIARDVDAGVLLRPLFEDIGLLTDWRWVQDKGILYVGYTTFEEAQSALRSLGNLPVANVSRGLNVKFSQRRNF
eukprot:TRINITY_DN24056_c0_g2_i1.p1 TRINITY_DN24056_c0_g2~~TRINITY_DN24056_c0_g2_i1.p1  ORF type:complete len:604 (-),score=92.71 TRINITY_DN24056_c0_g2_i1:273-2084(-)